MGDRVSAGDQRSSGLSLLRDASAGKGFPRMMPNLVAPMKQTSLTKPKFDVGEKQNSLFFFSSSILGLDR